MVDGKHPSHCFEDLRVKSFSSFMPSPAQTTTTTAGNATLFLVSLYNADSAKCILLYFVSLSQHIRPLPRFVSLEPYHLNYITFTLWPKQTSTKRMIPRSKGKKANM